jgi:glucosyl-dolichyl phosphate glucuronosyltransferase
MHQTISVVIATYNRATHLEATLERLCRQPFAPGDEIVVVDNGSTDTTPDVIARAAARSTIPLHAIREITPGKTPALNAGLAIARGEILALTDDDVLVAEDWIPVSRRIFEDPGVALVGGRVDPLWERPAPRWLRVDEDGHYGGMASPLALLHYGETQPLGARTAVGANLIVRRWVHDAVGGFAPYLGRRRGTLLCGEDHEFCEKVRAAGYRCEYRPELKVQHWVPADRATLRYYFRWFFWSGITNSLLERKQCGDRLDIPRHLWRQIAASAANCSAQLALARFPAAAAHAMDGAYALGYVSRRFKDWRTRSAADVVLGAHG